MLTLNCPKKKKGREIPGALYFTPCNDVVNHGISFYICDLKSIYAHTALSKK